MSSPFEFSTKVLEVIGLDPSRIASYMIVGDGDGVTINVEVIGDFDGERIASWHEHYKIARTDEPTARESYDRGVIADEHLQP
jgi:hypothetical protein